MSNKLQELTDKIYQEGVAKGNEEADRIISEANTKADDIINKARKEAESILAEANKNAEEIKKTTHAELTLSSKQAMSALKQEITNLLVNKSIHEEVGKALSDDTFVQNIIEITVKNWSKNPEGNLDLRVLVNEEQEKKVMKHFTTKAKALLDEGLEVKASKKMNSGFQITPKDGSYKLSFTEDDFANFFKEYLRPKMIDLLFNK